MVFFAAAVYVLFPMFKYESWPSGHDSTGTVFNSWTMIKALRENFHFPLIWQPENCGFKGNPYWAFYQPLSYFTVYLVSAVSAFFSSDYVFWGLKGATFLSFFISEVTMFFLLREIFKESKKKNLIATFGSLIYLLSPYRFIDLYSRNAYSELWVFPWMPLYFLGFYKLLFLKEKNGVYFLIISTPLLFLSHLMPSFFFLLIVNSGFIVFLILKRSLKTYIKENSKIIIYWFIGNLIGGLLSSIYILPAMSVIKFLNGDIIGFDRVSLNNVLEHISWCFDMLNLKNFNGPWQAGQLFLVSFFILLFLSLFNNKKLNPTFGDLRLYLIIITAITFAFLMSKTLWDHAPKEFYTLQFSWRLFLIYSFICSLIVGLLAFELNLKIIVLVLLLSFHFYTGKRFLYYGGDNVIKGFYDVESWINKLYRKDFTTTNNYSPHSILPKTTEPLIFSFRHADELATNEKYSNSYFLNLNPGINILSHKHYGNKFAYELLADNSTFLIFKQFYYPSWKLYIDSKEKEIYVSEFGYIGFEIPSGQHKILLETN